MAKKKVKLVEEYTKEELELLSYKDITDMILAEKGAMNTADLFKYIVKLLGLPKATFENCQRKKWLSAQEFDNHKQEPRIVCHGRCESQ